MVVLRKPVSEGNHLNFIHMQAFFCVPGRYRAKSAQTAASFVMSIFKNLCLFTMKGAFFWQKN